MKLKLLAFKSALPKCPTARYPVTGGGAKGSGTEDASQEVSRTGVRKLAGRRGDRGLLGRLLRIFEVYLYGTLRAGVAFLVTVHIKAGSHTGGSAVAVLAVGV